MTDPPATQHSPADLIPIVYEELRLLAAAYMQGERRNSTLQPTALVHEAYLALANQPGIRLKSKAHFKALAARQMRQILVDHARHRNALKRGRGWQRVTLEEHLAIAQEGTADLLAFDQALERLAKLSERQGRVAEYRLFGGLTEKEIADVLDLSERTVRADWAIARTWLAREIKRH